MKAYVHQTRISPRKVHLVAGMIKNKPVNEAKALLQFLPKRAAPILRKLLLSAIANAENNFQQKASDLVVTKVHIGKGATLKRFMPVSRGRAYPILKRTSNVTLEVGAPMQTEVKSKKKKSTKKKA